MYRFYTLLAISKEVNWMMIIILAQFLIHFFQDKSFTYDGTGLFL